MYSLSGDKDLCESLLFEEESLCFLSNLGGPLSTDDDLSCELSRDKEPCDIPNLEEINLSKVLFLEDLLGELSWSLEVTLVDIFSLGEDCLGDALLDKEF